MGRGSEWTFFQGRPTDDHQTDLNQNHNEVSPHTYQNGYDQKDNK